MTKRILIPTDYSKNAFNALKYAMKLFENENCEFHILNCYYLSGMDRDNLLVPEPTKEARKTVEERSLQNMENLKLNMKVFEKNEKHQFQYEAKFGPFFDTVKEFVEKNEIDLLIMGTQGQSDNKSVILGSNAVNLMEKIRTCPVMAIPFSVEFKNPNEIVFPSSYRTHYKPKELHMLVRISNITNAPIRMLHIQNKRSLSKEQLENQASLNDMLKAAKVTHHKLYDMDVNDGVMAFVQSRESEMIALVNKKHNFFGSIFSNPMVKELGMHTKVPLLAMHDER